MKLAPPISMATTRTTSMDRLSQWPIEASRVEKPPVDAVLRAWATASNGPIPAASRPMATTRVNPA